MIYDSKVNVDGKDAGEIFEELREAAMAVKPRPRQFTMEQLAKIKTEPAIEATLTAKEVTKELADCNDGKEFRNLDQLKDFINGKKEVFRQKTINSIKANKKVYKDIEVEMKLNEDTSLEIGEHGKHIELTCDYIG
jgi:hypothetical protein